MSYSIDRRSFLRGAGALMPLPFLDIMEASAKTKGSSQTPLRFVSLFKPNGIHPPSWNVSGGNQKSYKMAPLMQSFSKHKKDLTVFDNMGDYGFSPHENATRRFMCGHHNNKRSASMDQLIADKIGKETPVRSLELTTEGLFLNQIGCSYISYNAKGKPIPRNSDPQIVFDQLFRNPMSHPTKRQQMTSLLDRVRDDAKSLERRASSRDKEILDQYFTAVRETEKRLENTKKTGPSKVDFSKLKRPQAGGNMDEQVETMLDLIALALWTDSTRCISYMLGNSNSRMVFDFLGISEQHHYLSHFFRNFNANNLRALMKICVWHMEKFDSLLTKMKAYKDPDGKNVLDNSIVLFGGGMGHSDVHTATRIPTIIAGKGGGKLEPGRYLRYNGNQRLAKLHLAVLKKFDINLKSFGGESQALNGLNGEKIDEFHEKPFSKWVKVNNDTITVQARLRLSDKIEEAKVFYMDLADGSSVKLSVSFGDFHKNNMAYYSGEAMKITGKGSNVNGQLTITKLTEFKSIFGIKPAK
ncbi:MAG: DUF1552 domain-containing protein [Lentisphaeraceae bacterium]|nr:DUF1552 domain-containing protein [Lentisphaeraceae bacterium]